MSNFYAVNRAGEIVAGFDSRDEAEDFADNCRMFDLEVVINSDKVADLCDWLDNVAKATGEYSTGHGDFASGYDCLVTDDQTIFRDRFIMHIKAHFELPNGITPEMVWDKFDARDFGWEWEPGNEYAAYSGQGFCIASFDVGEQEEQIDVFSNPILMDLWENDALDEYLDCYNGDLYLNQDYEREYDVEKGYWVNTDRKSYVHSSEYPCLYGYVNCSGMWHAVLCDDYIDSLIEDLCTD